MSTIINMTPPTTEQEPIQPPVPQRPLPDYKWGRPMSISPDEARQIMAINAKYIKISSDNYLRMQELNNKKPIPYVDLLDLLLLVGQTVIDKERSDEWFTSGQVSAMCRRYKQRWQGVTINAAPLKPLGGEFKDEGGELCDDNVLIEYKREQPVDSQRRCKKLYFKF